jgi:hypothetical protein
VSRVVPQTVNGLALNGKCDAAKVLIASAASMGVSQKRAEAGLKGSSCK